ncbi:uncharacterized protein LOC117124775 [Anneissia japonica]|uniref:uncharacterized protein LOC117124775 n=1 Tax=Anneissia japonica TaxID=1529436 RepID=UPI0014255D64|nr:uncharacterized protein LOC117124775 [Anneissia japonica]
MAVLVMKIKEVAPKTSTATNHQFWKNDIKVAREYYDVIGGKAQGQNIGKKLFQDFQENLRKLDHGVGSGTDTLKGREAACVARDFKALLSALESEPSYQDIVQQLNEPQLNVSNQIPTSPSEPEWLGNLGWQSNTSTTTPQRPPYQEIYRLVSQDDFLFPGTPEPQSRCNSLHGSYSKITAEAPKEDPV